MYTTVWNKSAFHIWTAIINHNILYIEVETKKSDDAPKNKRVSKPPTTDQLLSFDEDSKLTL